MLNYDSWGDFIDQAIGYNVEGVTEFIHSEDHFTLIEKRNFDYEGVDWVTLTFQCKSVGREIYLYCVDNVVKRFGYGDEVEEEFLTPVSI